MEINVSTLAAIIALLVSISATYNAYVLRGGKLAWSQVLTALGTVSLMFALVLPLSEMPLFYKPLGFVNASIPDALYIMGFIFLFVGSLRLRYSLK